ncbi:hypothetical protein LCGC14_0448840 [marine sediment metagenome]|uniref:Uncharacterized protein n=1 Tax=marine sediment metagenome TaxID=412755 RepID=A0A0F9VSE8_9ZZZZ
MAPEFDEKTFYEGTPKRLSLTGSTGTNILQDGGIRAAFLAIPSGILFFLQIEYEILSTNGYAALVSLMVPAGVLTWAFFDKFVRFNNS